MYTKSALLCFICLLLMGFVMKLKMQILCVKKVPFNRSQQIRSKLKVSISYQNLGLGLYLPSVTYVN